MRKIDRTGVLMTVMLVASAAMLWAAVTPYSQDFEGLAPPCLLYTSDAADERG